MQSCSTVDSVTDDTHRARLTATLRRNADRAVKIIRSFERLPRSGIVADKPTEQNIDLAELVNEVVRQLEEMAESRGVDLRIQPDLPMLYLDSGALELRPDQPRLKCPPGTPIRKSRRRFIEMGGRSHDGHYEIYVEDNGIGIPSDALTTVFERFTRAHSHLDDQLGVNGTGLGLAIVEECVKSLGGEIQVQSAENAGTTFTIRIPKKLPPLAAT